MVSLCIQLGTMNFCNIKQLKTRIRRYLQTICYSCRSLLLLLLAVHAPIQFTCHLHGNGGRPCSRNSISNTVTTTDISHETW